MLLQLVSSTFGFQLGNVERGQDVRRVACEIVENREDIVRRIRKQD